MIIGQLTGPIDKVIGRFVGDESQREQMAGAMKLALLENSAGMEKAAASIVLAEAQGESWMQRNWRPLTMLVIIAIIANNYLLFPYMMAFGLPGVMLDLHPRLWDLMTLGMGGYVAGRSGEKIAKAWKAKP